MQLRFVACGSCATIRLFVGLETTTLLASRVSTLGDFLVREFARMRKGRKVSEHNEDHWFESGILAAETQSDERRKELATAPDFETDMGGGSTNQFQGVKSRANDAPDRHGAEFAHPASLSQECEEPGAKLEDLAKRINELAEKEVSDVIEMGRLLNDASKLSREQRRFEEWVGDHCTLHLRTVRVYLRLFHLFGDHSERIDGLVRADLDALARPQADEIRADYLTSSRKWTREELRTRLAAVGATRPSAPRITTDAGVEELVAFLDRKLGRQFPLVIQLLETLDADAFREEAYRKFKRTSMANVETGANAPYHRNE